MIDNLAYDNWNNLKKKIKEEKISIIFKEGEIWRISIGMNIKSESYGKGEKFRRPILILKKLSNYSCIGIPLSTKLKNGSWFCQFKFQNIKRTALIYQIRIVDINRFQRKMGEIGLKDFNQIKKRLRSLLNI